MCCTVAWAGTPDPNEIDNSIRTNYILADLVVIGSINNIVEDPTGNAITDPLGNRYAVPMMANFNVMRVVGSELKPETMQIRYMGGINGPKLSENQQRLLLLKRTNNGYTLLDSFNSLRDPAEAEQFEKIMREQPLKAEFDGPVGPFFFGETVSFKVKVTNSGKEDLILGANAFNLEHFLYSARMKSNMMAFTRQFPKDNNGFPKPVTVKAGESYTATLMYKFNTPDAWQQIFTPDSYLQMPVALRVTVRTDPRREGNTFVRTSLTSTATPWKNVMAGYALPEEAKGDEAE